MKKRYESTNKHPLTHVNLNKKRVKLMLKQSFSRIKKELAILLAVLFIASLTIGAVSACNLH
jgi:hypothetical protein